jgi:hypothetical protein
LNRKAGKINIVLKVTVLTKFRIKHLKVIFLLSLDSQLPNPIKSLNYLNKQRIRILIFSYELNIGVNFQIEIIQIEVIIRTIIFKSSKV